MGLYGVVVNFMFAWVTFNSFHLLANFYTCVSLVKRANMSPDIIYYKTSDFGSSYHSNIIFNSQLWGS